MQRTFISFAAITLSLFMSLNAAQAQPAAGPPPDAPPADTPPPDSSDDDAFLDISTNFMARYEVRENYADLGLAGRRIGELDGVAYRARFGLLAAPYHIRDGWHAEVMFVPQASGFWGDVSAGLTDAGLGVHEGYFSIVGKTLRLDIGRFEMIFGDHLVIGNVGWHETGRSFDGMRAALSAADDRVTVTSFATAIAEGGAFSTSTELASGDVYFFGVYSQLGGLFASDKSVELDAYLLGQLAFGDDTLMPPTETGLELTLGARAVRRLDGVTLRGEAGVQIGQRPAADSVLAAQVDGDVMVKIAPKTKLGAGGFYATGDDPATERDTGWNQLYPTAHKFLGFMDIMGGRTNVAGGVVKLRQGLSEELSLGIDGHVFARPETPDGVDSLTGLEADAWLGWKIGKGLKLRSQYALFLPTSDGPFGTSDVAHFLEFQLTFVQ